MAISYTNIWYDRILTNIRGFLRTEFKGASSVYIGSYRSAGNESIRLVPLDSFLLEESPNYELREYSVGVYYYHNTKNVQHSTFIEHILKRVSRIEGLFQNNINKNDATDGNHYFEGALDSCTLDATLIDEPPDFSGYIVRWEWTGKHLGNIS